MTRGRAAAVALAGLAALTLAGLGAWQVERRSQKLALIARVEGRLAAAPVPLPEPQRWSAIGADADDAYTRVVAAGRWLPVAPAYVQAVTVLGPGFWVLSPLAAPQGVVLVNRGFVAADRKGREARAGGEATVTGLLRITEPGGGFLRANDPAADRWFSRDTAMIGRARGLRDVAPFFVDADRSGTTWPRGGMTVVRFANNHLVYALTWFALAALAAWFAWRVARTPVRESA